MRNGQRCIHPHQAKPRLGLFVWCTYWRKWDRLVDATATEFIVQDVDSGEIRRHCTPIDATYFADQPFDVYAVYHSAAPWGTSYA